jgi:hypothetical protein
MPARDRFHNCVKNALIKSGWTITHDPFPLPWAKRNLSIDLGAERLIIAAERQTEKIAVEIKSFLRDSRIADLEDALGQYVLYEEILKRTHPDRVLYLAIPQTAYHDLFERDAFAQILLDSQRLKIIVYDHQQEEIKQWLT